MSSDQEYESEFQWVSRARQTRKIEWAAAAKSMKSNRKHANGRIELCKARVACESDNKSCLFFKRGGCKVITGAWAVRDL